MISKSKIRSAIDEAANGIEWCWRVLMELKEKKHEGQISNDVVNFQKRLIASLWLLDDTYREIHSERKRLIKKKINFNPLWFNKRMAALDDYRNAVRHAITVAKVAGDGFAWIFYRRESKLIEAHLNKPRQLHLPPNIGRIGERAFVEQHQIIEGKFVLYHGITTFLRLGDVSFYDFEKHRIANIGELKTEHVNKSEYRVNLSYVYGGSFSPVIDEAKIQKQVDSAQQLLPKHKLRLQRQLKQIADASSPKSQPDETRSQRGKFYFEELDQLIASSNSRSVNWKKIDRGLALGVLRISDKSNLSRTLLPDKKFKAGAKMDDSVAVAQSIVDSKLADNSLLVGNLGVGERGIPSLMVGTVPIFWWPLNEKNLYDLIFDNVIVMTLYNPAHFWHSLRERGFHLEIGDRAKLVAAKRVVGKRRAELHNLEYLQVLTTHHLMSEADLMKIIDAMLDFPRPEDGSTRIEIHPQIRM